MRLGILVTLPLLPFGLLAAPVAADEVGMLFRVERSAGAGADEPAAPSDDGLVVSFDPVALLGGPARFSFPLPERSGPGFERVELEARRIELRDGGLAWQGCPPSDTDCRPRLVIRLHRERLAGLLFLERETVEILPLGPGRSLVRRVLEGPTADCATTAGPALAPRRGTLPTPAPREAPVTITLLALYSAAARDGAGGVAEVEAAVLAAVDVTNAILADGPIAARLEVVAIEPFDIALLAAPPDLQTALDRLVVEPGVMTRRDEVRADLVALLLEEAGGFCGIGEVMDDVGPEFESRAYSITARTCLSRLTLAHEIGHNLGAHHNPQDSEATPDTASFPWSFGHVGLGFRTVMGVDRCVVPCPRLPYFSDPDRIVTAEGQDQPTGIEEERDNVRTLQVTAPVVAAFRTDPGGGGGEPTCTETPTRRCLGDRFAVEVRWTDFGDRSGPGRVLVLPSDDSVLFWFFQNDNWELLVKVLDACALNDRFWVFSAGATNVAYELTVTDTATGLARVYDNPLGRTAVSLTDTDAFATCP